MKIGIIGAGIAGLSAAWHLGPGHSIRLFEARGRPGGHADTEFISISDQCLAVDTGFIVFNRSNYPVLSRMLDDLGVAVKPSDMSFGVQHLGSGLVYNATSLNRLFVQRRNLFRPSFWRMLMDLIRFYRRAPEQIRQPGAEPALGPFLRQYGYSRAFAEDHLLPMTGALWSMSPQAAEGFPVTFLVGFMQSHGMLSLGRRPRWLTIDGGSIRYVEALLQKMDLDLKLNTAVERVTRSPDGVQIRTGKGDSECFDRVIMACHGDTALELLADPLAEEQAVLGQIEFQHNDVTLHTDTSVLPSASNARAAWNVRVPAGDELGHEPLIQVSYLMNLLQGLDADIPIIVSLNQRQLVDPDTVIRHKTYRHPVYRRGQLQALQSRRKISGLDRIHYCGAYWGWGFHESGADTGLAVAGEINQVTTAHAA